VTRSEQAGGAAAPAVSAEALKHDLSLMLMYLSSWTERDGAAPRFWKGFDFDVLNQLEAEGLIFGSRRAKSAYLTEAGLERARALLAQRGVRLEDA
jgi:hypothetical protein